MVRPRKRIEARRRKRNKIKATMASLILALVVSAQGLGTYALFTDEVDLGKDLIISLGDLDAEVSEGFHDKENNKVSKEDSSISKVFTITNNGTLKQSLNLGLEFGKELSDEVLNNINYKIESVDMKFNTISGTMEDFKSGKDIVSSNGNLLVLEPNEILNCKATVTFGEPALTALSGKTFNFNLSVKAKQVSWKDGGFYDVANQSNSITVEKAKPELEEDEGEVVFAACPCGECRKVGDWDKRANAFKIDISKIIGGRKLSIPQSLRGQWYLDGTKPDSNDAFSLHLGNHEYIYFVTGGGYTPTIEQITNRKLLVQFNFKSGAEEYIFTFKEKGNSFVAEWELSKKSTLEIVPVVDEKENSSKVDEGLNSEASAPVVEENLEAPNKEVVEPVIKEEVESSNVEVVEKVEDESVDSSNQEVSHPVKEETKPSNLNDLEATKKEELQE